MKVDCKGQQTGWVMVQGGKHMSSLKGSILSCCTNRTHLTLKSGNHPSAHSPTSKGGFYFVFWRNWTGDLGHKAQLRVGEAWCCKGVVTGLHSDLWGPLSSALALFPNVAVRGISPSYPSGERGRFFFEEPKWPWRNDVCTVKIESLTAEKNKTCVLPDTPKGAYSLTNSTRKRQAHRHLFGSSVLSMRGKPRIKWKWNKGIFKLTDLKKFLLHALFLKLLQSVLWQNEGEIQQRERHGIRKTRVTMQNNGEGKS